MTVEPLPFDGPAKLPFDPPIYLDYYLKSLIGIFGYEEVWRELRRQVPEMEAASAPARWTDPETSHRAAKREQDVGRFSSRSRQAKLLSSFASHAMTDQQATIRLVGSSASPSAFEGCRRRCSDLRAAGYLFDTGRRRKNAGSDDLSIIWFVSASGERALESLDATGWSRP